MYEDTKIYRKIVTPSSKLKKIPSLDIISQQIIKKKKRYVNLKN